MNFHLLKATIIIVYQTLNNYGFKVFKPQLPTIASNIAFLDETSFRTIFSLF